MSTAGKGASTRTAVARSATSTAPRAAPTPCVESSGGTSCRDCVHSTAWNVHQYLEEHEKLKN